MMNPKIQSEIESFSKKIVNTLENPNKEHTKYTQKMVASAVQYGLELALQEYRTFLPSIVTNPSPLYDSINATKEELREFIKV